MARIRTIKPEFFRHRELQDLAKKHGAEVMLVYIGLWTQCDKAGNFLWDEDQLALDILPFLGIKIRKSLDVLESTKYILKYSEGKTYGHIPTFKDHQMIFGSERKYPAKYPEPKDLGSLYTQGNTEGRPRTLELRNNGIKEKGKGQEYSGRFAPPTLQEVSNYCQEKGYTAVDPVKWMAHYTSNGWKVGRNPMKDWRAAVVTWQRNSSAAPSPKSENPQLNGNAWAASQIV